MSLTNVFVDIKCEMKPETCLMLWYEEFGPHSGVQYLPQLLRPYIIGLLLFSQQRIDSFSWKHFIDKWRVFNGLHM